MNSGRKGVPPPGRPAPTRIAGGAPIRCDFNRAPTAVRVLDAGAVTTLPLALPLIGAGLLALAGLAVRRRRG